LILDDATSRLKVVAVMTRNPQLTRLLEQVFADWKILTVANPSAAKIIVAEHGVPLPETNGRILWLSSMPLTEGEYLTTPLQLTELYNRLHSDELPGQRRYLRLHSVFKVAVQFRQTRLVCELVSLSERGGRLLCPEAFPLGARLHLNLLIDGRSLELPAEVIYQIPASDAGEQRLPQTGVLFKPENDQIGGTLRRYIEKQLVDAACAAAGLSKNDLCLSWIEVASDPFLSQ
jgi:hypothetical protein